jgi:hypothetical protein
MTQTPNNHEVNTMTNDTDFPGYLDINGTKVHVAEVRRYSADVHRFREYLPAALEMPKHKPHSPEWLGVLESVPDLDKLMATITELGHLQMAMADELRRARG